MKMKRQVFRRMNAQIGFTVLELLMATAVAAILAVITIPMFGNAGADCDNPNARQGPLMRARIAKVTGDIGQIHMSAGKFELSHNRYPVDLAEIGLDHLQDPWGNPYRYLVVFGLQNVGHVRKDHNLKPVNTGYDVYSMGPDGVTASPFTSTLGKDDIVMANDGDYFGLACQYNASGKGK
jgi:general secretion pathway protein G